MSRMTRTGLYAGAAALALTGVAVASPASDAANDQLKAQIEKLNARVAELEGRDRNQWLSEQRAAEVRTIVQDVLADADTRASLLGSGMQAGYDNGFTVGSADGNFLLRLNGQLQTRWMYSFQSDPPAMDPDRHRSGFENSRTKLWFSGHVVNPSWQYVIEIDFSRGGTFNVELLDAYLSHDYGTGIMMTMGQFKLPFLREQLIDARYLQSVERSLVHALFTAGRSQGLMASWDGDFIRLFGAFSDGANNSGTPSLARTTEWAFTVRGEGLLGGTWDDFNEYRSDPNAPFGLLVGAALHWERDEHGAGAFFPLAERIGFTADAQAKVGGFGLFGAYIFDHTDVRGGGNFQNHALVVQGGFHIMPEWEIFARYEHVWWDSNFAVRDMSVVSGGITRFFSGHQAKWTTDLGYGIRPVISADSRTGWRTDDQADDGQLVLRTQLQLLF
jgi:outer membrane murein-binding lipoprotein Lpp